MKNMIKKIVSLLVVVCIFSGMVTGCGKEENIAEDVTTTTAVTTEVTTTTEIEVTTTTAVLTTTEAMTVTEATVTIGSTIADPIAEYMATKKTDSKYPFIDDDGILVDIVGTASTYDDIWEGNMLTIYTGAVYESIVIRYPDLIDYQYALDLSEDWCLAYALCNANDIDAIKAHGYYALFKQVYDEIYESSADLRALKGTPGYSNVDYRNFAVGEASTYIGAVVAWGEDAFGDKFDIKVSGTGVKIVSPKKSDGTWAMGNMRGWEIPYRGW